MVMEMGIHGIGTAEVIIPTPAFTLLLPDGILLGMMTG